MLPGAVVWCTCLVLLGPAPNLQKGLHIAPNLLNLRLLHGLECTMCIRRVGGMLTAAARRELDVLNGLCTLCSPHNVDEAENILALIFGIWNISFFKQTLYL